MQETKIATIKQLVKTTAVFKEDERSEWLSLVDVMNDVQLFELERILTMPPVVAPKTLQQTPPAPLHLSHILNFPQKTKQNSEPKPFSDIAPVPHKAPVPKSNKFASAMQRILSRPELATSRPEHELELPAPHEELAIPKALPQKTVIPASPLKTEYVEPAKKPISFPLIQKASPPVPPKPPVTENPLIVSAQVVQLITPQTIKSMDSGTGRPSLSGLQNARDILDSQLNSSKENNFAIQKPVTSPAPEIIEPSHKPTLSQSEITSIIDKPSDVGELSVNMWRKTEPSLLINVLKALITRFSLHEILFQIERSDLYKAYLDTGMQILTAKGNFASPNSVSPDNTTLTKREFEEFVDVLRMIKSE